MKISFRMDSTASQKHNSREIASNKDEHIDRERSKDNITMIDIDVRQAYKAIFDRPIEEYNAKQKRKDRRLDYDGAGYYDKVLNSTFNRSTKQGNKTCEQHPYYEMILQIGDTDNHPDKDTCVAVMQSYLNGLKERGGGHLVIIGAYIHLDETTPHMHIDYIPVATYDRGMKLQTGLNRAFEQLMNYKSQNAHDTAQMQFQKQEREIFRSLCIEHGLDIDEIQHNDAAHKSTNEYKQQQVQSFSEQMKAVESAIVPEGRQSRLNKETVVMEKADYELLIQQAKQRQGLQSVIKDKDKQIGQLQGRLDRFERGIASEQQSIRDKKKNLQEREQAVSKKEQQVNHIIQGDTYKHEYQKCKKVYDEYQAVQDDIIELQAEKQSLGMDIDVLEAKKTALTDKLDELKEWVEEFSLKKYMRQFCDKFKEQFDKFAREQRSRDDLER